MNILCCDIACKTPRARRDAAARRSRPERTAIAVRTSGAFRPSPPEYKDCEADHPFVAPPRVARSISLQRAFVEIAPPPLTLGRGHIGNTPPWGAVYIPVALRWPSALGSRGEGCVPDLRSRMSMGEMFSYADHVQGIVRPHVPRSSNVHS